MLRFVEIKKMKQTTAKFMLHYTAYPFKAILILLDGILKLLGKGEWTSE